MDLKRWGKRVYTIDYTTQTQAEAEFVLEWIQDHPSIEDTAKMSGATFTFMATNTQIVDFAASIALYHQQDVELMEMEAYFNEH